VRLIRVEKGYFVLTEAFVGIAKYVDF